LSNKLESCLIRSEPICGTYHYLFAVLAELPRREEVDSVE
jgi:hypothetical protein